jgi:O-antigen ligase
MNTEKHYSSGPKLAGDVLDLRPSIGNSLIIIILGLLGGLVIAYVSYESSVISSVLVLVGLLPAAAVGFFFAVPGSRRRVLALIPPLTWWHGLWLLIYMSGLVFRPGRSLGAVRSDPVDAWAMLRIGPEAIVAVVLLVRLALKKPAWLRSLFRGMVGALAFYALVCLLSSVWSVYPGWTAYKSWEYLVDVSLLATILVTVRSTEDYASLMNWTWTVLSCELLWTLVQGAIWRDDAWDELGRLRSVVPLGSPNSMASVAAVVAIVALCRVLPFDHHRRALKAFYIAILGLSLGCLFVSKTRNSLAGFLFAVCLLFFFSKRVRMGTALAVLAVVLIAATSIRGPVYDYITRGQSEQSMESLTGRMDWWTFAWQQFSQHPVTGLGAYAGGKFAVLSKMGWEEASSLHSDYIETIVGTGIGGLVPLLAALIGSWWFLVRFVRSVDLTTMERQLAYECVGVLGVITVHSFFNVEMTWQAPIPYLLVVGYAEFLRRKYQKPVVRDRAYLVPEAR